MSEVMRLAQPRREFLVILVLWAGLAVLESVSGFSDRHKAAIMTNAGAWHSLLESGRALLTLFGLNLFGNMPWVLISVAFHDVLTRESVLARPRWLVFSSLALLGVPLVLTYFVLHALLRMLLSGINGSLSQAIAADSRFNLLYFTAIYVMVASGTYAYAQMRRSLAAEASRARTEQESLTLQLQLSELSFGALHAPLDSSLVAEALRRIADLNESGASRAALQRINQLSEFLRRLLARSQHERSALIDELEFQRCHLGLHGWLRDGHWQIEMRIDEPADIEVTPARIASLVDAALAQAALSTAALHITLDAEQAGGDLLSICLAGTDLPSVRPSALSADLAFESRDDGDTRYLQYRLRLVA